MRIAVYSLCRERLAFTKTCFASLREKAGVPFDHFCLDQGSRDGTADWLRNEYQPHHLTVFPENIGISRGSNLMLEQILRGNYDLICKFDNDCLVVSENLLGQMAEIFSDVGQLAPRYVLSPRVEGINNQPHRARFTMLAGRRVGLTAIVGGLFHCVPRGIYEQYRYPEDLPPGQFQDDFFCKWVRRHGGEVGYVEGLVVEHYRGTDQQAKDFPEYFERKWSEMEKREVPV